MAALNNPYFTREDYGNNRQILANVELQASVGCRIPKTMGVAVGNKSVVKAGTPVTIDLTNPTTTNVTAASTTANAVILHDVDVTDIPAGGAANGTALYFGIINLNRVEDDVLTKLNAVTNFGHIIKVKL